MRGGARARPDDVPAQSAPLSGGSFSLQMVRGIFSFFLFGDGPLGEQTKQEAKHYGNAVGRKSRVRRPLQGTNQGLLCIAAGVVNSGGRRA